MQKKLRGLVTLGKWLDSQDNKAFRQKDYLLQKEDSRKMS